MIDRRSALSALFCLLASAPAFAQISVINLKDGKKVEGFILAKDEKSVKLETVEGKTLTFLADKFDTIEETARWGDAELDKEFAAIDATDGEAVAKIAATAKGKNHASWKHLANAALKLDKDNETANKLFGYEKVGEKWYRAKKDIDEAKKKLQELQMKERGFVRVGNGDTAGWVAKESRSDFDKDPKKYMKDEERVYRKTEEVMRAQGKELVGGKWVRATSQQDKTDCASFKSEFEVDLIAMTSKHFRLFSTEHKADQVDRFLELAERNYDWFLKQVGKEPDAALWNPQQRGEMWFVKDKRQFDKVVNKWGASRFGMSADWVAHITQPGGGGSHSGLGLNAILPVENLDESGVMSSVVHNSSHMVLEWFIQMPGKGAPDWLVEGWSHYAEHYFMNIGQQTCVTKAFYGAGGGISDKKFTTKDAKDRCRQMAKDGEDDVFENISKKDLNSLNGDDLAKGYTIVDWLMGTRKADFVKFMEGLRGGDVKDGQAAAVKAALGWSYEAFDAEWKKMVRAKF